MRPLHYTSVTILRAERLTPDAVPEPEFSALFTTWNRARGRHPIPLEAAAGELPLPGLLSRVNVIDVYRDPQDFMARTISGCDVRIGHFAERDGRLETLLPPEYAELARWHYCEAVAERRPLLHEVSLLRENAPFTFRRALLPFSRTGLDVDLLYSLTICGEEFEQFYHAEGTPSDLLESLLGTPVRPPGSTT